MTELNLWGLWPHQETAVTEIESAWRKGFKALCYQCSTGGGKTRIFRTIVDNHANAKKIIYIIAHRKKLVKQLSDEIAAADIYHGIIAPWAPPMRCRVQVASLGTLTRRIDKLPEAELIIIDEFHHAKSASYMKILQTWPNALILGLTATPERLDGKPLSDVAQKLIVGPPMRELIDGGYLSDFDYYAPEVIEAPKTKAYGDYKAVDVEQIMDKKVIIGSAVDHYRKIADGLPAIACCASIAHAEHVAAGFRDAGYKAKAIHSKMNDRDITIAMAGLKNGSLTILCQCELLGEGIDIPGATVIIGLRHTASLVIFLQQIGRVLRKHDGKDRAIILDHVGNYLRHGLPDEEREWTLAGRSKTKDGPMPKRCPGCLRAVPASTRVCEYCGHQWTLTENAAERIPEEVEGELKIIQKSKTLITWNDLIEQIKYRAQSMKDSIAIAKEFGYKHTAGYVIWNQLNKKY